MNKHRGEFDLTVGDDTYTLRMTFSKVAELEDMGVNVLDTETLNSGGVQLKMFFVLTKGQHGLETIEDADELLMTDYGLCSKVMQDALVFFIQLLTENRENPVPPSS